MFLMFIGILLLDGRLLFTGLLGLLLIKLRLWILLKFKFLYLLNNDSKLGDYKDYNWIGLDEY